MHNNPLRLTEKETFRLGRLCAIQKPEVARELLSIYDTKPAEQDFSRIPHLFSAFCRINDVAQEHYQGPIYKGIKSDSRKRFIAAMVRMYLPHLYLAPPGIRLDKGFTTKLAATLRLTKMCVGKVVREVVVQEKVYEEFRMAVDDVTNKLMTQ
jgi:hypothetical protein